MEHFRVYDTLDSTNKEASRLLANGESLHETAILAMHQTEGKGQYGRPWNAKQGAHLAISIILQPPSMKASDLPTLSMKVSLAIARVLEALDLNIRPFIKWPNDVYVNNKKLAGILIENALSATRVQHSIIGIGMNVNEAEFDADLPNAISLFQITGKTYSIMSLAIAIREAVVQLWNEPLELWKTAYDQYVFASGQMHRFALHDNMIFSTVSGIDAEGKIILTHADGNIASYATHEIEWLI